MNFVAILLAILPLALAAPQIAPTSPKDRKGRAPPSPLIGAPSEQPGVARLRPVAKSPPSPLIGAPIEDRLGQSSSTTSTTMAEATPTLIFGSVDAEAMP
ncbi:hypothetical protein MP638_000522 [Amoeboaphelidium occidentale]|nr:hypothetical protein MP638_000522 [Amoeboaphelidium occidentale]